MVKSVKKKQSVRITRKREQARREILELAQSIMNESGPEAITLTSVAAGLGMTKQSLYHYFSSKEALIRALVATLLDQEIDALLAAVARQKNDDKVLGTVIAAFHSHYAENLEAFRTVYCQTQMFASNGSSLDNATLRDEIHPRTGKMFDELERRISGRGAAMSTRKQARQLVFIAWTSALGLITMLGVADANNDPVAHSEKALLSTLSRVFDSYADALS